MRTLTRRAIATIAIAFLACGLAACSGGNATDGAAASGSTNAANTQASGTLRYGTISAGAAPTTDPHGSLFSESDWARLTAVYDTLTTAGDKGEPAPALAESWTANDDATQWTFTLRKDATFSDGSPVTAKDALYSIGRMVQKAAENGSRAGDIDMENSKATDDHTLVLATTKPTADLPATLTIGSFVVKDGTTEFTTPVGSGPFVQETIEDQAAALKANPDWWGDGPKVAELEIHGFSDPQAMAQAVTGGSIDVASGVQPAAAKAAEGQGLTLVTRKGAESVPLLMRVDIEPFDDNRVREAVKLSLDRDELVDQVYLGYGEPGKDMIRYDEPGVPADAPAIKRDIPRAKELLAEAGLPNGFTTTLHTSSSYPAMTPLAAAVKEQLAEAGITVEIKTHAPDQYWTTAYGTEPFTVGYYGDNVTFGTLIRASVLSDAAFSETGWKNPAFDEAFYEAMSTTDTAARLQQTGDLHRTMAKDGGWAVGAFGDRLVLARENVNGLTDTGNLHDLTHVSVSD